MLAGMREGIQKGIQKGKISGESEMLLRLLNRKFSYVPLKYQEEIAMADAMQLLVWSEKLLDARVIEEVFEG